MKILVIGFGSAGQRHAKYLLQAGAEVAAYDPRYRFGNQYNNADAFVIASPSQTHKTWLLELMKFKKPILVEKPAVMNLDEWEEVRQAQEKYQTPVYVAYQMRFLPRLQKIQANLTRYRESNFTFRFGYDIRKWHPDEGYRSRDGILLEASHEIDLALQLLRIFGVSRGKPSCESLLIHSIFGANECSAKFWWPVPPSFTFNFDLDYTSAEYERRIEIDNNSGAKELIAIVPQDMEPAYQVQAEKFLSYVGFHLENKQAGSADVLSNLDALATFQQSREGFEVIEQVKRDF